LVLMSQSRETNLLLNADGLSAFQREATCLEIYRLSGWNFFLLSLWATTCAHREGREQAEEQEACSGPSGGLYAIGEAIVGGVLNLVGSRLWKAL
jgi:hypothetical protein